MTLHERLTSNDWTLLVSLPANDLSLARAALEAGAHGLKVHINVEHFASGTRFGNLTEERKSIAGIVQLASEYKASVGIVPGANGNFASPEDFAELRQIGVDYFDAYPFDCPAWALSQSDLTIMIAAYHGMPLDELVEYEFLGMRLCEASVLGHEDYGKPLSARDLAIYASLCKRLEAPVIVPSQKKIEPRDVPSLQKTGVKGVLIGAIVTGREAQSIENATRAFATASAT